MPTMMTMTVRGEKRASLAQANEFTDVEDLFRAAAIYAEAIYELIK